MARMHGLHYTRAASVPVVPRDSQLTQLKIELELAGSYSGIRSFVHSLETSPEFVVLENVALSQGQERDQRLNVVLRLATYFRAES